jgi:hypothetical protein
MSRDGESMKNMSMRRYFTGVFIILLVLAGLLALAAVGYSYRQQISRSFVDSLVGQVAQFRVADDQQSEFTASIPNKWGAEAVVVCPSYGVPEKENLIRLRVSPAMASRLGSLYSEHSMGPEGVSFYLIKGRRILHVYSFKFINLETLNHKFLYGAVGADIKLGMGLEPLPSGIDVMVPRDRMPVITRIGAGGGGTNR